MVGNTVAGEVAAAEVRREETWVGTTEVGMEGKMAENAVAD